MRLAGGNRVGFAIGLVIALGCILGGFAAMGGHVSVIFQPWEFVIILGTSLGTFIIANPLLTIKDTGLAIMDAILDRAPKQRNYLDVLGVLYTLMRELRGKACNEVEQHVDNPNESTIFKAFPQILADKDLTSFICDYCRLIIIGNATVVIANPTHYAVALRYVREEGGAPLVVSKGKDFIALKIREIAEQHSIP